MSLEELGNLGEFIAAVATILTLAYLALQIRQNTRALKTTSHQETTREATGFTSQLAGDAELAEIFNIGARDWSALEERDRLRLSMLLFGLFFNFQNIFTLHKSGAIDEEYWRSQLEVMRWFMSLPGVAHWWGLGKNRLRESFVSFVQGEIV